MRCRAWASATGAASASAAVFRERCVAGYSAQVGPRRAGMDVDSPKPRQAGNRRCRRRHRAEGFGFDEAFRIVARMHAF